MSEADGRSETFPALGSTRRISSKFLRWWTFWRMPLRRAQEISMRYVTYLIVWTCWLSQDTFSPAQEASHRRYAYNRDIRPILANNCFACHGFDSKQRQANLRLDRADGAYGTADSGLKAIVPGHPDQSKLWLRIQSTDADSQMPPKESHKSLTESEKEILRAWIEQGAEYQGHWAFEPVANPELMLETRVGSDATNGSIDVWIERGLKELGVTFA
jgi:Planctomycete cytochrome C